MTKDCGNLGAFPKPPHFLSAFFMMFSNASLIFSFVKTLISPKDEIPKALDCKRCSVKFSDWASISFLLCVKASVTLSNTSCQDGRLNARLGGKYVPP